MAKKATKGILFTFLSLIIIFCALTAASASHEHPLVKKSGKPPSCSAAGNIEYYQCTECMLYFRDADAEQPVTKAETVIPATGKHVPITTVTPATMKKNGKEVTVCRECASVIKTKTIYSPRVSLPYPSVIYSGKARTAPVTVKNTKGQKISSANYTVTYPKTMKMPGSYKITVRFKGKYSGSKTLVFKINTPKTEITSAAADDGLVKLKWKNARGATGYNVYMSDSAKGTYKKIKTVGTNTYTKKQLTNGKKYYFKVRAYIKTADGKYHLSAFSSAVGVKVKKAVKITLNKSSVKLNVGTVITLKSTTYPSKVSVKWSSSDKNVATVKSGKVFALNTGQTVITGYFTYKDVKYKARCTVSVTGSYATDMNGEKYALINPDKAEKWYLIVVNRTRRVSESYTPKVTGILTSIYYDQELDSRVAPYYEDMYYAARKDGVTLAPYSAFRYYSGQKRNYLNRIALWQSYGYGKQEAIERTVEVIMAPGGSEHNLGLAVDINGTDYDFDNTAAYRWLHANAHKYGFIQRYPEGKSSITGVVCEPWHWRYVGKKAATEMHGTDLCLEEYLDKKGIAY